MVSALCRLTRAPHATAVGNVSLHPSISQFVLIVSFDHLKDAWFTFLHLNFFFHFSALWGLGRQKKIGFYYFFKAEYRNGEGGREWQKDIFMLVSQCQANSNNIRPTGGNEGLMKRRNKWQCEDAKTTKNIWLKSTRENSLERLTPQILNVTWPCYKSRKPDSEFLAALRFCWYEPFFWCIFDLLDVSRAFCQKE